jgi:uncharacterized RmlC-like cupin family protein
MRFMRSLYPRTRHPSIFAIAEPTDTAEGFFLAPPESHQDIPLTLHSRNLVIATRKFAKLGDTMTDPTDWKHDGVRVIPAGSLDTNTAQTPGMNRAAAINFARVGAQKLWAGTVTIHAHAKTGAHHHGHLESVIYVVKGRARMRWGDQLQFVAEAGPGDFIYVPPYVPHQEINASETEPLECVLVRSDNEAVAINIDITPAEKVEEVYWVDPTHPHPHKH